MDPAFKLLQCGYFAASQITSVNARGGSAVIAGNIHQYEDAPAKLEARVHRPLQKDFGGGGKDGYFAVFKMGNESHIPTGRTSRTS